jgi:hypothetical protein
VLALSATRHHRQLGDIRRDWRLGIVAMLRISGDIDWPAKSAPGGGKRRAGTRSLASNSIDPTALDAMASRKSSLTALPFNCGSQKPHNIILINDNGLPADLTSKGYFGLAFHCVR